MSNEHPNDTTTVTFRAIEVEGGTGPLDIRVLVPKANRQLSRKTMDTTIYSPSWRLCDMRLCMSRPEQPDEQPD